MAIIKFTKLSFCQKYFFWHQTSSCKYSMCLQYVGKVSDGFSKSSGTSWFPHACTIWALTKPLLIAKSKKKLSSKHCHFVKKYFYGIKVLHANVQYVYIVYGKVSDGFSKNSGTSWFPHSCTMWALTKSLLRSKVFEKWLSSKPYHFVKKYFYGIKRLHANVQCDHIVYTKHQDVSVYAVERAEFPVYALSMHYQELQRAITLIELAPSPYML